MQDRNVEFPNRFRVVKVEGTDDIYDVIPAPGEVLNPGTLLNKANLLTDETAALLGLESEDPTVNEAFVQLNRNVIEKPAFQKIASYETAGSYQWTAPDLADGKPYKIGVFIIGAGAGGGGGINTSSSSVMYAIGGPSGFTTSGLFIVNPGDVFALVVGAGGVSKTMTSGNRQGASGGTSSFGTLTADGGHASTIDIYYNGYGAHGASPAVDSSDGFWGGAIVQATGGVYGRPDMCLNPFEGNRVLGSGGSAEIKKNGESAAQYSGGKDPVTGLGGGDGVCGTSGSTARAGHGTTPGSGGGAAVVAARGTAIPGAGADGAVYIYFLGVADE